MGGGIEYWGGGVNGGAVLGGGGTVLYLQCTYSHTIFQDVILISFDRPDTLTNLDILSRQGALQKLLQILTSGCIYLPLSLTDLITRRIVRDSTQIVESLLAK